MRSKGSNNFVSETPFVNGTINIKLHNCPLGVTYSEHLALLRSCDKLWYSLNHCLRPGLLLVFNKPIIDSRTKTPTRYQL